MFEQYNNLPRDDEYYRAEWGLYYAERRRRVVRLEIFVAVTFAVILFVTLISRSFHEQHPLFMNVVAVLGAILMLIIFVQWIMFNWVIGGWMCPRCREPFFRSTLVNNPFGMHCRHCKLRRLKKSEGCEV